MLDASPSSSSCSRWTNGWRMLQFWRCQTSKGKALNRIIKQTDRMDKFHLSYLPVNHQFVAARGDSRPLYRWCPWRHRLLRSRSALSSNLCCGNGSFKHACLSTIEPKKSGETQKQTNTQTKNIKSWPENAIKIWFHHPPALRSI